MGDPGLAEIRAAAARLEGALVRTPLVRAAALSERLGSDVWLKLESLQRTGSFKERGALTKLLSLSPDERARGVVAMSAGNHAQGVARHAARLGIPALVVMPRFTPNVKVERTRALGAAVELAGETLAEAHELALERARERGGVFVHPYDDPQVIAGQGTVALEILADAPDLDALVVPIGGGGLAAGCALALAELAPKVSLFGVQSARFPAFAQRLAAEPVRCGEATLANGIAVAEPGERALAILRGRLAAIWRVEEEPIELAVLELLESEKLLAEGAGAAPLAGLAANRAALAGRKVVLVISGGNVDMLVLAHVIERGLARTGRLARIRVRVRDVPGALAEISTAIADAGANVVDVLHERAFGAAPSAEAELEFVLETRGARHLSDVLRAIEATGHAPQRE